MKPLTLIGILLIVLGLAGFAFGGLGSGVRHFGASDRTILRSQQRSDDSPWTPYLCTIALVAGLGMVVFAGRSK